MNGEGLGFLRSGILFFFLLFLLSGCTTTPDSPKWGEQATALPGWSVIGREARKAATDQKTWMPLAAAALLYSSGADEDISDWAVEKEPLFSGDAEEASDDLKSASQAIYLLSVLAADSGDSAGEWLYNKGKGALVGATALTIVSATTDTLKEEVGRERPDETNSRSFISGHASYTAARINLAAKNLEYTPLDEQQREIVSIGLHTVTATTAWARVEGETVNVELRVEDNRRLASIDARVEHESGTVVLDFAPEVERDGTLLGGRLRLPLAQCHATLPRIAAKRSRT